MQMSTTERGEGLPGTKHSAYGAMKRTLFSQVSEAVSGIPGALAAIIGLACVFASDRSMRITTLVGIYPVEPSLAVRHGIASLVLIALLAWVSRGGRLRLFSRPGFYMICSLCLAVSLAAKYSASIFGVSLVGVEYAGKVLEEAFECVLLFCWAACILPRGLRSIVVVALALAATPFIQLLLSFLQRVPCMVMLALLPLASFASFYLFVKQSGSFDEALTASVTPAGVPRRRSTVALYAVIVFCLSFVLGSVIYESLGIQDAQSESPVLQLCIIGGNFVGGAFSVLFSTRLKSHSYFVAFLMGAFASCAVALYLAGYFADQAVGGYLFVSSVALQVTVVLVWFSPFSLGAAGKNPLCCFSFMYATMLLAKLASALCMILSARVFSQLFSVVTSIALVVLFSCCSLLLFRLVQSPSVEKVEEQEGVDPGCANARPDLSSAKQAPQRAFFREAVEQISEETGLTRQETRVFSMLARGMNATAIAEELVVSTNTVKSHMRNAYAKLGVHSQQEIISLVRTRKDQLRDE